MVSPMHLENLKIFVDLVENESFSKSGRLNGITQSAVSQQLRKIERDLNALILDRSQKSFRLTREGQLLYEAAKRILHHYEKFHCELQELQKIISGTIRLATIYSIGLHELPPFIKFFLQQFPAVNVRVEYRRSNLVYEDILTNSVDLGLVAFPQNMRQIEALPFREDELTLICSPEHALARRKQIRVPELEDRKFIAFDPDIPTRKAIDAIFREHKLKIEPVMEFDNIETVKRAVEINAGIAIVPRATVAPEVKQGTLKSINLNGGKYLRPLSILHRKGRALTPAIRKFIEVLQRDSPPAKKTSKKE